jgi:hypothetical protein
LLYCNKYITMSIIIKTITTAITAGIILLSSTVATAADIRLLKSSPELGANIIVISGEIVSGDYTRFLQTAAKIDNTDNVIVTMNGPGGLLWEAIQIGMHIHKNGYSTAAMDLCVSACAYVWLAGDRLAIDHVSGARIGFHAPYVRNKFGKVVNNNMGSAWLGAYLRDIGASYDIIGWVTSVDGSDILWLTPEIAKELEIDVKFITKK